MAPTPNLVPQQASGTGGISRLSRGGRAHSVCRRGQETRKKTRLWVGRRRPDTPWVCLCTTTGRSTQQKLQTSASMSGGDLLRPGCPCRSPAVHPILRSGSPLRAAPFGDVLSLSGPQRSGRYGPPESTQEGEHGIAGTKRHHQLACLASQRR